MSSDIVYHTRDSLRDLDRETLIGIILKQGDQLRALDKAVQRLGDQTAKTSTNSSQPPSSDGLKKREKRSLREKSGKASGGQAGHPGHTLAAVREPDAVVVYRVERCTQGQADLQGVAVSGVEKRQVFDLPEVVLAVTEHQAECKQCPCCGAASQAAFPAGVSQPTQYGPRIRAQMVYFHSGQFIPLARTADMLADLYGQAVSEATISAAVAEAAQRVSPVTEALRTYLVDTPEAVHLDESGARVAGKLHWVHSAGTAQVTLYGIHPKRGSLGMDALGVLPSRHGWCVHDGWRAYNRYAVRHALCNAHHLRELTFIHERYQQQWAADLRHLLGQMKTAVARARAAGYSTLPLDQDAYFRLRYDRLLDAAETEIDAPAPPTHGRAPKNSPPTNLLNRLRDGRTQVLAFMTDFSVPFDNNPAERDIRMLKVQQKISGGFRTLPGADLFCTVRSYLATARKNGQSLLAVLTHAFHGQPYTPLCLLPPPPG